MCNVLSRRNKLISHVASHNYHHAFPSDYRNGPLTLDWDPTKWLIWTLHRFTPLVTRIHQTPKDEILRAQAHVLSQRAEMVNTQEMSPASLPTWKLADVPKHVDQLIKTRMASGSLKRPVVILLEGYAVDVSSYAAEHPGGVAILRNYAVIEGQSAKGLRDATAAFNGGMASCSL